MMTVNCEQCGKPFEAQRRSASFCSSNCRVKAHRYREQVEQSLSALAHHVQQNIKIVTGETLVPAWQRKQTREALQEIRRSLEKTLNSYGR